MSVPRDYGALGRYGLLVPQANPTVEPEFRRLMPEGTECYVARLASRAGDPRTRLTGYLERLPETLAQFDTLRLDAAAFACTGSSYLLGPEREARLVAAARSVLGAPVETAAGAIVAALERAGARRLFVLSPYPDWLRDAGLAYWRARGYAIAGSASIATGHGDTRGIYELQGADAAALLERTDTRGADVVLVSGTGLPTLGLLRGHGARHPLLLSSNLCLAWWLQSHAPPGRAPSRPEELLA